MVNWQSPEVVRICFDTLGDVATITLGMFTWYLMTTFSEIELRVLTGRLKFAPLTHLPYLIGRYSFLFSTICFVIILHWYASSTLNCEVVMMLMAITGDTCLVTSSLNMTTRLRAVWNGNKIMLCVLTVFTLGHIATAILVSLTNIHVYWNPVERMCQEVYAHNQTNIFVFYLYTCIWDLIILVLTIWGLRRRQLAWDSHFGHDIRWQGLVYIVCTFVMNTMVLVFSWKDLNTIMDIVLAVPGGAVNVIMSSSMVTYFMEDDNRNVDCITDSVWRRDSKQDTTTIASTIVDLTDAYCCRTSSDTQDGRFNGSTPEIRVQTPSSFEDDLSCTCYSSDNAGSPPTTFAVEVTSNRG